jgi:hypothetical protein
MATKTKISCDISGMSIFKIVDDVGQTHYESQWEIGDHIVFRVSNTRDELDAYLSGIRDTRSVINGLVQGLTDRRKLGYLEA